MTRFARAKGSKSSNERREEDATPWHVMRQQLADQLKSSGEQVSISTREDLKNLLCKDANSNKIEVWSDFGEPKPKSLDHQIKNDLSNLNKKKAKKEIRKTKSVKEKIVKKVINVKDDSKINDISMICNQIVVKDVKKRKQKDNNIKQRKVKKLEKTTSLRNDTKINGLGNIYNEEHATEEKQTTQKDHDNTNKLLRKTSSLDIKVKMHQDKILKKEKTSINKKAGKTNGKVVLNLNRNHIPNHNDISSSIKEKSAKENNVHLNIRSNKKSSSEKAFNYNYSRNFNEVKTIYANGREIKIIKFEAFWVKEDDAAKLKKLKKKLKAENIPNDKIKALMKLERRRAEKALAREKTNVCYNCRQFGHKFSECPDIKDSELSKSGICFKCGSTEHSHYECKVQHSQGFRHAVCFVCQEQGHIARQCPLNPQGQYPKGGSCHVCGEVTHLRKDCPKAVEEKPSKSTTVEKLQNHLLEDISVGETNQMKPDIKKNKVVVF